MTKTNAIIPALQNLEWVQVASVPVRKQPPVREVVAPPPPQPAREKRSAPINALTVRGLIPHMQRLIGYSATLDPSSVEIVETCGRVYLCRFLMVKHPDPMLPIVGLTWPEYLWTSNDALARDTIRQLSDSYDIMAHALAYYSDRHKESFRAGMSQGTNTLLRILADGSDELCTDKEYSFVALHLTNAIKNPQQYR